MGGVTLAVLPMVPAQADSGRSALAEYARARIADASGSLREAAQGYSDVLTDAPYEESLALRAYRRAIAVGDRDLAMRAAQRLKAANALPPDGEFLFLIEALEEGDWREAGRIVDAIEEDGLFESLVPVLRSWIAFGARDGDPVALLDATQADGNVTAYAGEHRALLLIASERFDEGIEALEGLQGLGAARMLHLKLATAAQLVEAGQRDRALALLEGEGRALETARRRISRRRNIPGAIDTASAGIAEVLVRLAAEVNRRNVPGLAMTLARFSTFLAPDNSVTWLVTSAVLNQDGQEAFALSVLDNVGENDPFFADAQDARLRLLADTDEGEAAFAIAQEQVATRDATISDWQRYGEMAIQTERYDVAAEAYGRAVELAGGDDAPWTAWLLYGGALLDAGRWEEARTALEKSVQRGENQPVALNYLGYAMLERREDLDRAEELIAQASELQPDSPSITDSLGWAHYVQGDVDTAIPILERAARGDPDEPTINEHLGDAYWAAGRRREARFAWQAALVSAEDDAAARLRSKMDIGLTPETASP